MTRARARLELDGRGFDVELERTADGWAVTVDGERFEVAAAAVAGARVGPGTLELDGVAHAWRLAALQSGTVAAGGKAAGPSKVRAPMTGRLESVKVAPGQAVAKGDVLFVLEAMKMLNEVRSATAGRVVAVHAKAGATLEPSQVVLDLEPT
ncbi:MAG: hypothetical protein QOD77_1429 [Thermoplasmata archaeon]|jgi:biotin carboxyl carrier protein|nr:hypothetical protein [Thermoplasmata archaeon]